VTTEEQIPAATSAHPPAKQSILTLGLALLVGVLLAMLIQERRFAARTEELLQVQTALKLADQTMAVHLETTRKLAELTGTNTAQSPGPSVAGVVPLTLTSAPAPVVVSNAPVEAAVATTVPAWTAANQAYYLSQVEAPKESFVTNSAGVQRIATFARLSDSGGRVLLTNAEFRGSFGRRLMFRPEGSYVRNFDYTELHPGVLAHLSLEPSELVAQQNALDTKKAQAELAAQKAREAKALADKKYQEALKAASSLQARINSEKKKTDQEEKLRLQALETERMKAEAAMLQAEAAMEKAKNPQPVILLDTRHQGLAPLVNPQTLPNVTR
jgi:hypothetical protein